MPAEIKQNELEKIASLVKENNLIELKNALVSVKKEHWWNYHSDKNTIECAARDAILAGHEEAVKLLLEAGLSADAHAYADDREHNVETLLHFAIKSGQFSMVKLLVENGAKIYLGKYEDRDHWNNNFGLRTAVIENQTDIVDYLLKCGAEANGLCGGGTLGELHGGTTFLAKAAENGNTRMVELLVKHGASVTNTLDLAYEKMYVHGYKEYQPTLAYKYSEEQRIDKLDYAFDIINKHRASFYHDYSLTPKTKRLYKELHELLKNVDKNNEQEKNKFIEVFTRKLAKEFNVIVTDKAALERNLNDLLDNLAQFDKNKKELEQKIEQLKSSYARIVKTCLDYAMGCNFKAKEKSMFSGEYGGLLFLADLDVSHMNFVGISVAGEPITPAYLEKEAKSGADKAIITVFDIAKINDPSRRKFLQDQLRNALAKQGDLTSDNGIVNLISLKTAAAIGNMEAVKARIQAGEDPNLGEDSPLVSAAKNGHIEMVKMLFAAHKDHTAHKVERLTNEANNFLLSSPVRSVLVANGKLQEVPISSPHDKCLVVLPEEKTVSTVMGVLNRNKYTIKGIAQQNIWAVEGKTMKFIFIIKNDKSMDSIQYNNFEDPETNKKVISLIQSSLNDLNQPVIFTNANNLDVIKTLITMQYAKMDKSKTAMMEAIEAARRFGHKEIVTFLEAQQDVNQQNANGETLLHQAVKIADIPRIRELIQNGADVNIADKNGQTPLNVAAQASGSRWGISEKHTEVVRLLLEHKADPDKYKYSSPLELAIKGGNVNVTAMLLPVTTKKPLTREEGYGKKKKVHTDPWYVDMMFSALEQEEGIAIALLTMLKAYGADFNTKSEYGETLLNRAVNALPSFSNIQSTMGDLVRAGYDAPRCGDALEKTHQQLIEDSVKDLPKALAVIDFLLSQGADPKIANNDGKTPLALLIAEKDLSHIEKAADFVMDRFVRRGANVNAVDNDGLTPLHVAAKGGDIVAISYLLDHGASINAQTARRWSPLHYAAACGNPQSATLLLERGADFTLTENEGLTPAQLAISAMEHNKKIYNFSSFQAEKEFEKKYWNAKYAIEAFIAKPNSAADSNMKRKEESLLANVGLYSPKSQPSEPNDTSDDEAAKKKENCSMM